ncbi:TIGR03826 family flagellar region protein [Alkalicoccus urumqiensis]|uniref:Flagellar protein n=1 Tax=Alkalicoccus urumqiensis TaxID=1548213 RepID=A0A2P6MHE4_ALKUR|nr:TIGR03826 family flagellar region protein [Alkalicoccus urumqiensis]PRO65670.1 hypothetical protein C6I21_09105 [Alkalicoccus urumqiensis]
MPELSNCPKCGGVFVKALRSVCEKCHREVEEDFEKVYSFIRRRENRRATMEEVNEATGVSKEQIATFVREGRILASQFPGLSYPCESCETPIREGRLCDDCRKGITDGLKTQERERSFQNRKDETEKKKNVTYHSLGDRVNRDR